LGTRAGAGLAGNETLDLQFFLDPIGGLFERDLEIVAEIRAALAALGLAPNGASAAEPMANPTAPSALPWGRDREAERERERLQAALRQKLASGDGSHQKRQPKKK
jgi:hypothetical protein